MASGSSLSPGAHRTSVASPHQPLPHSYCHVGHRVQICSSPLPAPCGF
uniref:Uncharacterized protein n=1 Tax=Coturnix japonica TaxID=93934 RepID=A0A8C2SRW2_COTJA